jgi:hypothetical protein
MASHLQAFNASIKSEHVQVEESGLACLSTFWSWVSQIIRDECQEKSFSRVLGQIIKAVPLQRTIMDLSCSLTIRYVKMLRLGFAFLNSGQLRQQRQPAEREGWKQPPTRNCVCMSCESRPTTSSVFKNSMEIHERERTSRVHLSLFMEREPKIGSPSRR